MKSVEVLGTLTVYAEVIFTDIDGKNGLRKVALSRFMHVERSAADNLTHELRKTNKQHEIVGIWIPRTEYF